MTETKLIDRKAIAEKLRLTIAADVAALKPFGKPGLAVVLVGDDPASGAYVRNKARQTVEAGMRSFEHRLPAEISQGELVALVQRLNDDAAVHGILVQLPLPPHLLTDAVIAAIDPAKDVDGFHVLNAGRLATGTPAFVPCTPVGCMMLLQSVEEDLKGMSAIVIGRSNTVGKPMAQLLLRNDCTVTMAHSQTRDLPDVYRRADIVVAAVGRPGMIRGSWLKPGAIVVDVGINRVSTCDDRLRLLGDVAFDETLGIAGHITPVPGGVGPMTIACLLANTLTAFKQNLAGVQDTGRRAS